MVNSRVLSTRTGRSPPCSGQCKDRAPCGQNPHARGCRRQSRMTSCPTPGPQSTASGRFAGLHCARRFASLKRFLRIIRWSPSTTTSTGVPSFKAHLLQHRLRQPPADAIAPFLQRDCHASLLAQGNRVNDPAPGVRARKQGFSPSSPRSEATENHREGFLGASREAHYGFSVVLGGFASRRTRCWNLPLLHTRRCWPIAPSPGIPGIYLV